jgi:hypothetical protein
MRSLVQRAGRFALPLILVALFFFAFVVILNASFPHGASLGSMVRYGGFLAGDTLASNPLLPQIRGRGAAPELLVARMSSLQRSVRHRSADSVAWAGAYQGMELQNRSAVQTLASSNAVLDFEQGSRLVLGENTLAVVRKFERDPVSREKTAVVLVLTGELEGSVAPAKGDALRVQVTTGSASGRILGARSSQDAPATFRVSENPDHTSTFSVFSGEAEVSAAGRSVRVGPGYTITVDPKRPLGRPARLPQPPALRAPQDGAVRWYRTTPPPLTFTWIEERDQARFWIEIARDPAFENVVHCGEVEGNSFFHGNLPEGDYWWRVASVLDWARSAPGNAQHVRILKDIEPPDLHVNFPELPVASDSVVLSGRTEANVRICVADSEVQADANGDFQVAVKLMPGIQPVVVQAMDAAGNVSHRAAFLLADFQ